MKMCVRLNEMDGRSPFRLGTLYELLAATAEPGEARDQWLAQAADSYALAVGRDPYSPRNYVALGALQRLGGDLHQARSSFSQALEYEPNYLPARALRIEVDVELGNTTDARDDYETLLRIAQRWNGNATSRLEQQFISVDLDKLQRLFPS
jgi:tetratricopeptide (TPR) repeat protein